MEWYRARSLGSSRVKAIAFSWVRANQVADAARADIEGRSISNEDEHISSEDYERRGALRGNVRERGTEYSEESETDI